MCTLNADEYDTFETEEIDNENVIVPCSVAAANVHDVKSVCKKCASEDVRITFRNRNAYCKVCFLNMSMHKFKATLGKSKLVRPNDTILIAHSGKANSTVLAQLVTLDADESISKKLKFQSKVLYIDDGMVKGRTIEQRESLRNAFAKEAESLNLPTHILSLSKSTSDTISDNVSLINESRISTSNEDVALQESFDNLESDTARDELLRHLRQKLLILAARKLNCNKVFVADTSVDLAIKVLGDISTGRGSQLPFNVAFSDVRHADAVLLRPLRDFTGEDINGYLDCCELYPIFNSQKRDVLFPASIRSITKDFVHQLDTEYCGTVSTIYRTSEKLATRIKELARAKSTPSKDVNDSCIICELPIDSSCSGKNQLSVMQAQLYSEQVSTVKDPSSNILTANSFDTCKRSSNGTVQTMNNLKMQDCQCHSASCNNFERQKVVEKQLCYSCRLIFLDPKRVDNGLPTFILKAIEKKLQITRLRNEIEDFLL